MAPMAEIYVLGAGGHAKVLIDALKLCGIQIAGVAEPGDDEALLDKRTDSILLVNGVGGVGDTVPRRRVYEKFKQRGFRFATVRHPAAIVADDVELGEGVQIMAGAVVQPGARIGDNTIVNTRAVVDHDCDIGNHCHIAPGATLSGMVTLGEGAHIGAGATVIQSVKIGAGAVIGAGAAVVRDVPAGVRAVGVPAK